MTLPNICGGTFCKIRTIFEQRFFFSNSSDKFSLLLINMGIINHKWYLIKTNKK